MPPYTVLVTDCAWPSKVIERDILAAVDAGLVDAAMGGAPTGDEAELIALAPQADAILTTWQPVTPAVLDAAVKCRLVSNYGIGVDNIALDHATRLGIPVTNVPDYCFDEVSDHAMALLLACARRTAFYHRATRNGTWDRDAGRPMYRLRGQTLGLIGYGNIARVMAPKARGFGMQVLAYDPYLEPGVRDGFVTVSGDLGAVLSQADYVSIQVPLTVETRRMVDERFLRRMKPTAYLINTARGPIVDERALLWALREGWIAGAGLDVLAQEPPHGSNRLLALDNVIVTPHAAFDSVEATEELQTRAARHIVMALQGETPPHVLNPEVCAQDNYRVRAMFASA